MPNPIWTFNSDGTITNNVGTVKHFTDIVTNHVTTYNSNSTLSSADVFGTINLTGGSAYTLPVTSNIGDQITIVNNYTSNITLTFNGSGSTPISPGGVTSFVCITSNMWIVKNSSMNPVFNPAVHPTDPVTLLDMGNALLANYSTQSSITNIVNLPATLTASNAGDTVMMNSASAGALTLYDPRTTINGIYPATLIMNSGVGSVTVFANTLNGSFTEQQNLLLTGQYMVVVGGSGGVFNVLHTNNRNPLTNGLLLESGIYNIIANTTVTSSNIGGVYIYGSTYSNNITITLPLASSVLNGHAAKFTFINRSSGNITLVCSETDTIANGSVTLLPNTYKTIISNASNAYMVISDNSDVALKNGNITNTFSVATPAVGTDAVNVNKLYSELTGIEGYSSVNVTLNNTTKANRIMLFTYNGSQTVTLPPLASRSISGSGLTILLKTSLVTTLTISVNVSDTYDVGYSNVLNPGEYVILTYNATDTQWRVTGGNLSHSAAALNMERIMGVSSYFASLFSSTSAGTLLNAIGGAPLSSAALTGSPTAPNVTAGDNSTKIANTSFVATAIAALVSSSPAALDTLNELATALGDDPNFATTMTTALAGKQPLNSILTALTNNNLPIVNFVNSDANTIVKTGVYVLGIGNTNIPSGGTWLFSMYWSTSNAFQTCYSSDGGIWTRVLTSSWSSWVKMQPALSANYGLPNYGGTIVTRTFSFNTVYTTTVACIVEIRFSGASGGRRFNVTHVDSSGNMIAVIGDLSTTYVSTFLFPMPANKSYKFIETDTGLTSFSLTEIPLTTS